jgi:hypothetical protein
MTPSDRSCPIVCLTDVTDPEAARSYPCVRTLADDAGNRYVLLTAAQYLRLLCPGTGSLLSGRESGVDMLPAGQPGRIGAMEAER